MPTTRPRHTITETDELTGWLDAAAARWPQDAGSRSRLLLRLVEEGHRVAMDERAARLARRRAVAATVAAEMRGTFAPGYLARLREDWRLREDRPE